LWLSPDLKQKFLAGARHCGLPVDISASSRIGLAVSGGPDSLALLALAHECFPGQIAAATVDHRLRKEAHDEAQYVAEICAKRSIPHEILTPPQPITGNIQSAARKIRYSLLEAWADANGCDRIATAHHANDQLETMLMRLARGSGVDGLAGIRTVNGRIIRPLLEFSKIELLAICVAAKITPVDDPSNIDTDFDRVKMRQWLAAMPHPLDPVAATRSAAALDETSLALEWMVQRLAAERIEVRGNQYFFDPEGLPRELLRRLVIHIMALAEPEKTPKGEAISRLIGSLSGGKTVTQGNILCIGGPVWQFRPAPPRKNTTI
jgi:tRNA(Ile)-lysidine synthase